MEENKPLATKQQIDDLDVVNTAINDIFHTINKIDARFPHMTKGREKALAITKLEEAAHWLKQDIELHHKL